MKVTGIIAEYNPFHNGHKRQLDFVKKTESATVVVMSGSYSSLCLLNVAASLIVASQMAQC